MEPIDFPIDSDLTEMTDAELVTTADGTGFGIGSIIGAEIVLLEQARRRRIMEALNQLIRMIGG
jgi:hypothetical protein